MYSVVKKVKKESVINVKTNKETISDKLDKGFLNKYAAIPIFVFFNSIVFSPQLIQLYHKSQKKPNSLKIRLIYFNYNSTLLHLTVIRLFPSPVHVYKVKSKSLLIIFSTSVGFNISISNTS